VICVLLIKIALVSLTVGLIAVSGRVWGASIAGLLSGLPVIGGPILWFIYQDQGAIFARNTALTTVGGIAALSSFCFSYSWLCRHCHWSAAYILGCGVFWLVAVATTYFQVGVHQMALFALATLAVQLYLFPALHAQPLFAPATRAEVLFRMAFAFLLVLGITQFAQRLGHQYSGLLTVFPIAGSAIAIFSHRNHSPAHAMQSLYSMMLGLLSMLTFFYVAALFTANFALSLLCAASAALAVQVGIVLLKYVRRAVAA
jgi:hypothetical protein